MQYVDRVDWRTTDIDCGSQIDSLMTLTTTSLCQSHINHFLVRPRYRAQDNQSFTERENDVGLSADQSATAETNGRQMQQTILNAIVR